MHVHTSRSLEDTDEANKHQYMYLKVLPLCRCPNKPELSVKAVISAYYRVCSSKLIKDLSTNEMFSRTDAVAS